jgi:glycosyltransferase 2 family protein
MRRVQFLLLAAGIALFVLLVKHVGVGTILGGLRQIGWSFLAILAVELVIDALHTEGWRHCLPASAQGVRWLDLFLTRTAGVAINVLTPTASVGGEVLKGMLLRRWVPLADGFASVMVDKLTFALGQALYLVAGLAAVFAAVPFGPTERLIALAVLVAWLLALLAFFFLQRAGIFRLGMGAMRAIFGGAAMLERLPLHARAFDDQVTGFLRDRPGRFWASVGWHLLAQAARTVQFYLALSALGMPASLAACFTTASGLVFMEATLFLVPAKLGVFEGGNALIFERLGYGAATGLVVAFTLRLSELASALVGLGALAYYQLRQRPAREVAPSDMPSVPREDAAPQESHGGRR